jgi:hypothetical protein
MRHQPILFSLFILFSSCSGPQQDGDMSDADSNPEAKDEKTAADFGSCENSKFRIIEPTDCLKKLPDLTTNPTYSLSLLDSSGSSALLSISDSDSPDNRVSGKYDIIIVKYPPKTIGIQKHLIATNYRHELLESKFHFDKKKNVGVWIFKPFDAGSYKFKFTAGKTPLVAPVFVMQKRGQEKTLAELACNSKPLGIVPIFSSRDATVGISVDLKLKIIGVEDSAITRPHIELEDPSLAHYENGKLKFLKAGKIKGVLLGCGQKTDFSLNVHSSAQKNPICTQNLKPILEYSNQYSTCMILTNIKRPDCTAQFTIFDESLSLLSKCQGSCTDERSAVLVAKQSYSTCSNNIFTDSEACGSGWERVRRMCVHMLNSSCKSPETSRVCGGFQR